MNTQKSVFNKISKIAPQEVELSEVEKIELASDAKAKELAKDFRRAENGLKEKKKVLEDFVKYDIGYCFPVTIGKVGS